MPHPEVFTYYVRITKDIEIEPNIIIKKEAIGRFDGEYFMFWPKDVKREGGGPPPWFEAEVMNRHEQHYILLDPKPG